MLDEVIWNSKAAYVENMNPEADDTLEKTSLDSTELSSNMKFLDLTIKSPWCFGI